MCIVAMADIFLCNISFYILCVTEWTICFKLLIHKYGFSFFFNTSKVISFINDHRETTIYYIVADLRN